MFTDAPVYVDTNAVPAIYILPATPQIQNTSIITDTLNWVKVSGIFTALGGERYLTLGNFRYNNQTATQQIQNSGYLGAIYYIDDVSVIPLDSMPLKADAGEDRTIPYGSSTYIGSYTTGLTGVSWYNSSGGVIATNVPGLTVTPATNTFYVIEQTVCGNYSRDTVYVNVQPMPLTFLNYDVAITAEQKALNTWTTANEINVSHINVQRSSDGIFFYTIATVAARNGLYNQYSYTDMQPLNGSSYYRLQSIDKDGKSNYSEIKKISLSVNEHVFVMYPNPARDVATIKAGRMAKVFVTDINGKAIAAFNIQNRNSIQLNISEFLKGIYIIHVLGTDGSTETQKLIIR